MIRKVYLVCLGLLPFIGCAPTLFKYERPANFGPASVEAFGKSAQKGTIAIVNPIGFPQFPNPEKWQQNVSKEIQKEFVYRIKNTNLFDEVQISDSQKNEKTPGIVIFNIILKDSCRYAPYYYGFVAGEKEKYSLSCDIDIRHKNESVAHFNFTKSHQKIQGMWFVDVFVPLFPIIIRNEGVAVSQLTADLFRDFEIFILRNTEAFRTLTVPTAIVPDSGLPTSKFVSQIGTIAQNTEKGNNLPWQRFRKPESKVHSICFGLGYYKDDVMSGSNSAYTSGIGNYDRLYREDGVLFTTDYTLRPFAILDHSNYLKGTFIGRNRILCPELFANINFSRMYRTVDVAYNSNSYSDSSYSSRETGGHSYFQIHVGPRIVLNTMKHFSIFCQGGIGMSIENASHLFDRNDYLVNEKRGSNGSVILGGGLKLGGDSNPIQLEPFANAVYSLTHSLNPEKYLLWNIGGRIRYNFNISNTQGGQK